MVHAGNARQAKVSSHRYPEIGLQALLQETQQARRKHCRKTARLLNRVDRPEMRCPLHHNRPDKEPGLLERQQEGAATRGHPQSVLGVL